ncbi:UDP-N-acetylmuramate dehydrogenase [Lachnoclostridium phytofermentans]|uniref:UDP-N-acetylmuramate dehydrogenase n=1 Tax=Lachnoclostridium phytofermentans TaxID=66219 RepID=UPI000495D81A|nr:UDP-N-acetylmuramate dehydrogenase [Lachnoclostridium phytofermentans]
MDTIVLQDLKNIVSPERVIYKEPLSKHTTFKIGGPADYFVITKKVEETAAVIQYCNQRNLPILMIGNGSNLLISDAGLRGVVVKQEDNTKEFIVTTCEEGYLVTGGAGMNLSAFAMKIANESLTGFEFAAGIPGSLGGAVYMNAGAYGGEIKDCIRSARVLSKEGDILNLSREELELSYRSSMIQKKGYYVIDATFLFQKGEKEEILSKIEELNRARKEKQPLEYPSAGSTFKRPEGYFAGKLIMDAGLRGYRVGGAMVSEKHCGFVINTGDATAKDVLQLIDDIRRIVKEKFGVTLEPEVRLIGEKAMES